MGSDKNLKKKYSISVKAAVIIILIANVTGN